VYPALAVLKALEDDEAGAGQSGDRPGLAAGSNISGGESPECGRSLSGDPSIEILWVGSETGMEAELVKREGIKYRAIPTAGVHGVGLRALPNNLWKLWRGLLAARNLLREYRPEVMLFTGGYVAVPVAVAARMPGSRIPRPSSLLFVPDIEPGLALKALARFTDRIALSVGESIPFLPRRSRATVTGYPTRDDMASWTLDAARQALGLSSELPTLLVTGGSSGARSINRALMTILPELLSEMQVVHLSGNLDWPDVQEGRARLAPELARRYLPYPYLHREMGAALKAADLVVSRAGASSLGEYPLFGLPAILVPYPYAWRYQMVNAQYLEAHGAGVIVEDADLQVKLLPVIRELMRDSDRRASMQEAMQSLAKPNAARSIAELVHELASQTAQERR
jgi:UDP-N-acetylglucosamine--N-acetylmuramyl-(pentapeptide) pyrophosphoryl-undecaprenol N-acetylglucosamine transferase